MFLTVPKFQNDIEADARAFTAIIPPTSPLSRTKESSIGIPVLSGPGLFAGYISVVKQFENTIVEIGNFSGNYLGTAGLYTDVTIPVQM